MSDKESKNYTVKEYLALEAEEPEAKYEYVNSRVYAMSGGSINHGVITGNVFYHLRSLLGKSGNSCSVFSSDVKVEVAQADSYFYPDIFVVCGQIVEGQLEKESVANPILIIEVLSSSTSGYDNGDKFKYYRMIPSFKQYITIDQYAVGIESFYKEADDKWQIRSFSSLDDLLALPSVGIDLTIKDIYEAVRFDSV